MRIERISEDKIRITISNEDLSERNLSIDTLIYNTHESRALIWDMIKRAESEFGFTTSNAQLAIEAEPNTPEEYVVTITKIEEGTDEAFESIQKYIKGRYKKNDIRKKRCKKTKKASSPFLIYSFDNISDLKSLTSRIGNRYKGESKLYKRFNTYYLILKKSAWSSSFPLTPILQEYGQRVSYVKFCEGFLNEYATQIESKQALTVIAQYY